MSLPSIRAFAIAAVAFVQATPASAQEWWARPTPLIPEIGQGNPMCTLSSGETLPFVMFTFEKERTRLGIGDSQFLDRNDVVGYDGRLPSGATFTISLGSDAGSHFGVLTFSNREAGLGLIEHFFTLGDFSVSGHGINILIPALPSAAGEIATLQNCLEALENV